jgi:L-lactate dehydrogenase complex protein LldF
VAACPVKIENPGVVGHRRAPAPPPRAERRAFAALAWAFADRRRYERGQRLARLGRGVGRLGPLRGWTASRELPRVADTSFREWWRERGT